MSNSKLAPISSSNSKNFYFRNHAAGFSNLSGLKPQANDEMKFVEDSARTDASVKDHHWIS